MLKPYKKKYLTLQKRPPGKSEERKAEPEGLESSTDGSPVEEGRRLENPPLMLQHHDMCHVICLSWEF